MKLKEYLIGTREDFKRLQEIDTVNFDDYNMFFEKEGNLALITCLLTGIFYNKSQLKYAIIPSAILAVDLVYRRFGIDLKKEASPGLVGIVRESWHKEMKKFLFHYNTTLVY